MSFIQPDVSLQPKIWMDWYFTTTKVNCGTDVAMKLQLMVMLMREIMIAAIKLKAMMEKVVAKKRRKQCCVSSWDAQPIVRPWPALSVCHCQQVLRGVCMLRGPLSILSPHSLQSPTPDRATSKLEELCFVGPWSLDSQHVVLWLWTSAPFNPFCRD